MKASAALRRRNAGLHAQLYLCLYLYLFLYLFLYLYLYLYRGMMIQGGAASQPPVRQRSAVAFECI